MKMSVRQPATIAASRAGEAVAGGWRHARRGALGQRGFTLIEMLLTISLVAILVMTAASLGVDWVYRSQTRTARTQLMEAFDLAKALAQRNPAGVLLPAAAAGMKVTTDGKQTTVLVCTGSAAAPGCAAGGSSLMWSTTYPGMVTTTIGTTVAVAGGPLVVDIDNRGEPSGATTFLLTRGANDEKGALY